jgi:hypothetical protein
MDSRIVLFVFERTVQKFITDDPQKKWTTQSLRCFCHFFLLKLHYDLPLISGHETGQHTRDLFKSDFQLYDRHRNQHLRESFSSLFIMQLGHETLIFRRFPHFSVSLN